MNKVFSVSFIAASLMTMAGCAQFTTSDADLANMKSVADTRAEEYISCMKTEASTITSSTDYAFIAQAVSSRCKTSLDTYRAAQKEYLSAQYLITTKPLNLAVADLEERGQNEVAEMLVSRDADPAAAPVAAPAQSSPGFTLPSTSVAAASAAAVSVVAKWNPEQRVYLDCMDEQADKYARLSESAESIAAVAADRCRSYLTVERRQALEEEGRVQVMGKIMDQRVSGRR
jgi:hypothetical protein